MMPRVPIAFLVLPLLASCESLTDPPFVRTEVMQVAAFRVDCVGVGPQTCMQVRHHDDEPWSLFYDGIEGFTHEAGFAYELLVAVYRVPNPPADGSSVAYRLVKKLKRVATAPPGS